MKAAPGMALALALGLLNGCGPDRVAEPSFPIELTVDRAFVDQLGSFQLTLLTRGTSLDCSAVQRDCLVRQVPASQVVTLTDEQGRHHPALVFPADRSAGVPRSQDVALEGIPAGSNFALVVEALSNLSPPQLLASSCNYVKEIKPGVNPIFTAAPLVAGPAPVPCDPRFER